MARPHPPMAALSTALVAGLALGLVVATLLPDLSSGNREDALNGIHREVLAMREELGSDKADRDAGFDAVALRLDRLEAQLELLRVQRTTAARPPAGSPEVAHEVAIPYEWTPDLEALPKSVARALVSRGFTPYDDPRIAVLVREAVAALFAEDRQFGVEFRELSKLNNYSNEQVREAKQAVMDRHSQRMNEAVAPLEAYLDTLLAARVAESEGTE